MKKMPIMTEYRGHIHVDELDGVPLENRIGMKKHVQL
jgi:hypothetical protein